MIDGIRPLQPPTKVTPRQPGGRFSVAIHAPPSLQTATPAAPLGGLETLLALQDSEIEEVLDRAARRRGVDLLNALSRLQLSLLTPSGVTTDDLRRLAELASSMPPARDPALADILAEIRLRARIELQRRGEP